MSAEVINLSCYKFAPLEGLEELRTRLQEATKAHGLKGTILLAPEGINFFLAGTRPQLAAVLEVIRAVPGLADVAPKESPSSDQPFKRMLVKIKKEIIPLGRPDVRPLEETGRRLAPAELKRWLDERRDILLLDTRNDYEVDYGTFEAAVSLQLGHFREFPEKLASLPPEARERPLVMFCTGGIRCEKASVVALRQGFKEVYQLDGGILKYFEECGGEHYEGQCFVFDRRVAVGTDLAETIPMPATGAVP